MRADACCGTSGGIHTVVYLDILIVVNTIINFTLLHLCRRFLHIRAKNYRLILTGFVSSFSSLLVFCVHIPSSLSFLIRLGVCLLSVLAAFGYNSYKELLKRTAVLFVFCIIFCGLMIAVWELFRPPNMVILNDIVYFDVNPLLMLALTAVFYLIFYLFQKLFTPKPTDISVGLQFTVDGNTCTCRGIVDTGCNLTEPFSGDPVIVVDRSVFDFCDQVGVRVIPCQTVNASSLLSAKRADSVKVDDALISKTVYIAVSEHIGGDHRALLNPEILQ